MQWSLGYLLDFSSVHYITNSYTSQLSGSMSISGSGQRNLDSGRKLGEFR